jgi:hypothetical protein
MTPGPATVADHHEYDAKWEKHWSGGLAPGQVGNQSSIGWLLLPLPHPLTAAPGLPLVALT